MLAQKPPRISDSQQAEIVRLAIQQVPQAEIARRVGVQRKTVGRVLARQRAALTINQTTDEARAEAVQVYRAIQATAWRGIEDGKSLSLLDTITRAQQRIDALLGTAPSGPDDPSAELARFKAAVLTAITSEAPAAAPRIAQRLLERSSGPRVLKGDDHNPDYRKSVNDAD